MKVVVEGDHSESVYVESGVPKGTVLDPLLFLCHINDLPDSSVINCSPFRRRLFIVQDDKMYGRSSKITTRLSIFGKAG